MKALNIARKTLLELVREALSLGLMLLFPVMLIFFYYIVTEYIYGEYRNMF